MCVVRTAPDFWLLEYPHAPACPQPVRCVLTECAPYKIRRAQGGRIAITFYTVRNTPRVRSLSLYSSQCVTLTLTVTVSYTFSSLR